MIVYSRRARQTPAIRYQLPQCRYEAHVRDRMKKTKTEDATINMNTEMGSSLLSEKLDQSNYSSWEYKMNQYLVGQRYWTYINDGQENKPEITNANYPTWEQGANRVMYFLATCVHDHMLSHIRDAKTPKEAWEYLKKIFSANTSARKLQLRQHKTKRHVRVELHRQDQEKLRLTLLNQRQHQRRRDGSCVLGRPCARIHHVEDDNLGERNLSLVVQPPINAIG